MRTWAERRRVRRLIDLFAAINRRDFDALADAFSPDLRINDQAWSLEYLRDDLLQLVDSFPDFQWDIDTIIIEGDTAAVRYRDTGTSLKEFQGLAPISRKIDLQETGVYRFQGSIIVEMWISTGQTLARESIGDFFRLNRDDHGTPYERP